MKIAIGADHGGFDVKELVRGLLEKRGVEVDDFGCYDKESVDYPDYAALVKRDALGSASYLATLFKQRLIPNSDN